MSFKIEAREDSGGDPMYLAHGHVDMAEFRARLGTEFEESEPSDFVIQHCFAAVIDPGVDPKMPDGGYSYVPEDTHGAIAVTVARI